MSSNTVKTAKQAMRVVAVSGTTFWFGILASYLARPNGVNLLWCAVGWTVGIGAYLGLKFTIWRAR